VLVVQVVLAVLQEDADRLAPGLADQPRVNVAAAVRAAFDPSRTLLMAAATAAFVLVLIGAARPVLCRAARAALRQGNGELGVTALAGLLVLMFVCAILTNLIGIFALFGAFVLGAVLSGEHDFRTAVNRRLRDLVAAFFLPLFFAYTGLRTDVGSLGSWELGLLAGLVCVTATAGKLGGCTLAAWLSGLSWRESACVGTLMNTRGLMTLIVVNLGKDLGVVSDSVYCMLVLMALLTTLLTTPLLLRLMPGTELEGPIRGSGFLGAAEAGGATDAEPDRPRS
jgi:Kef-type K+ transport system membrane component KefB